MSGIPVHVQRSFEQRWAAKLASSGASARSKAIDLKGTVNSLPRPATAKETNDNQLAWPFIPFPESGTAPELPRGPRRFQCASS